MLYYMPALILNNHSKLCKPRTFHVICVLLYNNLIIYIYVPFIPMVAYTMAYTNFICISTNIHVSQSSLLDK